MFDFCVQQIVVNNQPTNTLEGHFSLSREHHHSILAQSNNFRAPSEDIAIEQRIQAESNV